MTTPLRSPGQLPAFNMSLTHVTLPTSRVQVTRQSELVNEITLGTNLTANEITLGTSVVVIVHPHRPRSTGRDRHRPKPPHLSDLAKAHHPRGPPAVEGGLPPPGPHLPGHLLRGPP